MNQPYIPGALAGMVFAATFASCSSLRLEPADFGWPLESALTVSASNTVEEIRYGMTFNVAALAAEEFQDTSALRGAMLRLLRGTDGYYYVTGPRFEHLYVFAAADGALTLKNKVRVVPERPEVLRTGLTDPALNQRSPYVELLDGGGLRLLLTADGVTDNAPPRGDDSK